MKININLGRIQTKSNDNCRMQKLEEVPPVEHDGFVDGVRHEPLRGLRDVLPQLVVRTVLLLQQAFANTMRQGFVTTQAKSVGDLVTEKCAQYDVYRIEFTATFRMQIHLIQIRIQPPC